MDSQPLEEPIISDDVSIVDAQSASEEPTISDTPIVDAQTSAEEPAAPDTATAATDDEQPESATRSFPRRLLFKGLAAVGVLATACGGVAALATSNAAKSSTTVAASNTTASANTAAGSSNPITLSIPPTLQTAPGGKLREYWIQADAFFHNLMPTGVDDMSGTRYLPNQTSYWAIGYRAYTAGWKTLLPGDNSIGANAGIPGPVLRAEVGDTVRVHFRNNDTHYRFCHSMHPHGLLYTPANDGSWIAKFSSKLGTALTVGETFTYEWKAVASSVGSWPYHDHAMPANIAGSTGSSDNDMGSSSGIMELGAELGLFGMIVVTDAQTTQVDREIILCFQDIYETDVPQLSQDFDCFNGYAYLGNTPTFEARVGERVRWRVMALGKDFHVFHLHGHRWLFNGRYDDALVFGPSTTLTFDYVEDNPGIWLYHCHVTDHMMGGMVGYYVSR